VIKNEAEKIIKYKDLTSELAHVECKTNVVIIIIIIITATTTTGATGTISKSFTKYPSNTPEKHEIKEVQKTAVLGTAHTLCKVQNVYHGK
jgi:hypothetical protein